jgi:nucleoside-diphosphate-sugar epimerase
MVVGRAMENKKAQVMGALDVPHSHTYIGDFGRGLVVLSESPEAYGRAWHIPNDRPEITQRELVGMIYAELGFAPKFSVLTRWMTALAAPFIPVAREGLEMMYEFEKPFVVTGDKMRAQFGFEPTPIEESVRRTVAWFKENQAVLQA